MNSNDPQSSPAEPLLPAVSEDSSLAARPAPAGEVPEDLRTPWGWKDLLVFTLVAIAGTFVLSAIVLMGFAAFGVHLGELRVAGRAQGLFNIVLEVLLCAGLIGYLAWQIEGRFHAPFWPTIGWRRLEARRVPRAFSYVGLILGGFVLALVVQLVSALFGTKANLPIESLFEDRLTAALILVLAVLMAPLVEEIIFRGYIFPVVARSFGRGVGVVVTGTVFGLLHAPQLWGGWTEIALLIFFGIVLTYARAASQTVLASYLLHTGYNFAVSVAFLVGSHWLRFLPSGS